MGEAHHGRTWTSRNLLPLASGLVGRDGEDDRRRATWRPLTLYATADGGDTWTLLQFGMRIHRMRVLSGTVVYACGDRVYRWTP